MRAVTFAAGAAVGYLFGTKAGRQRYEQIVASARQLAEHPTVAIVDPPVISAGEIR